MGLRRIQLFAVVLVLFTLFLVSDVARPVTHSAPPPAASWSFEGCWTQFSAGPCRDVFRDQQGDFWICRACGTTGNPSPGKCNPISQATLQTGFWCS